MDFSYLHSLLRNASCLQYLKEAKAFELLISLFSSIISLTLEVVCCEARLRANEECQSRFSRYFWSPEDGYLSMRPRRLIAKTNNGVIFQPLKTETTGCSACLVALVSSAKGAKRRASMADSFNEIHCSTFTSTGEFSDALFEVNRVSKASQQRIYKAEEVYTELTRFESRSTNSLEGSDR